ncbi:MAG TPA: glycosyltransferase family 2 protein, partial [Gemmatimonadaceae bacterium]|nr:glycosyltransferase family 2 protein [Gemmatimonadaceae bacterium]
LRARHSRSLDEWSDVVPPPVPRVSVVIPARDEARNIERCLRSVLATTHPWVEVIVVDDHSRDGTGGLARAIAESDARVRVIAPEPLPEGWFGKQWACAAGAAIAAGDILLFTDADTVHAPDLIARAVNAMRARGADLLTVAGRQELGTFWERVVQPQFFALLLARYGGTERVSTATNPGAVIANGQCIFVRRDAYDASGGHEAVRHKVAEDLALAQRFVQQGRRLVLVAGLDQLSTRMYTSLDEIVRGWLKNVYAGGRDASPFGRGGRVVFPAVVLAAPLFGLAPPVAVVAGVLGYAGMSALLWGAVGVACMLPVYLAFYHFARLPLWYALLYPLGLVVVLYIVVVALARGPRVQWKGRAYTAR